MRLSKKQKQEAQAKTPVKLTRAEKKEIQAIIRKYKGDGKPHSAQDSIPYEAMYQRIYAPAGATTSKRTLSQKRP